MPMHNHITPQEYLKHFATDQCPDLIWRHDKREGLWESLSIMRAGQRKDFYPPEEESRLCRIEQSALVPLNQLRERSELDGSGRVAVGEYLAAMIARTEHARWKMADYLSRDIADAKSDPDLLAKQWKVPVAPMLERLGKIRRAPPRRSTSDQGAFAAPSVGASESVRPHRTDELASLHRRIF